MDRGSERLYLLVLVQQLEFAAFSFDELTEDADHWLIDDVMRRIHAFLTHAACASRMLWPTPGSGAKGLFREERGEHLRDLLAVEDDNPLGRRHVRNFLEHFDEKLDSLLATLGTRPVVLQSLNGIVSSDPNQPLAFRDYNTQTHTFTVLGESEEVDELRAGIQEIGEAAYALLNRWYLEKEGSYPENLLEKFPQRRERRVVLDSGSDPTE